MKYRDYIIGPENLINVPKGKVLAIPEGRNETLPVDFEGADELYEIALDFFKKWKCQTGSVDWKGLPLRASSGMPLEFIQNGGRPIVYFREPSTNLRTPEELNYPLDLVEKFMQIKTGIVLFCGDQGSGKTTGMLSFIRHRVQKKNERAVTFESPPEYIIAGHYGKGFIDQILVPSERYYAQCASISLRMASPDVVCYGELRDYSGVKEICNNALSSHVIVTTLHSTDIITGIERLIAFLTAGEVEHREYYMRVLSDSLKLCIHQKLIHNRGRTWLSVEYLEQTEAVRSAIYGASTSARLREVLERQMLLRKSGEM